MWWKPVENAFQGFIFIDTCDIDVSRVINSIKPCLKYRLLKKTIVWNEPYIADEANKVFINNTTDIESNPRSMSHKKLKAINRNPHMAYVFIKSSSASWIPKKVEQ